ncbi:MAG: hypothetical protein AAF591_14075 [Verrucomicrobiota bacterium]
MLNTMNPARLFIPLAALALLAPTCKLTPANAPDIRSIAPDLTIPPLSTAHPPTAGKRVRQTHPQYANKAVYHTLYLPVDWQPDRQYPVIVEFTGNGGYKNKYGDTCSGRVEDSKLGYGLSAGSGYIWLCLPYLNESGTANVTKWWGDKPSYRPAQTVAYAKTIVPWICSQFGGDPDHVILAGFSRGSIACNYIGLHDDEIAQLWRAFIPYSVYDGVRTQWPYPEADRASAIKRLNRLQGRPQFILDEVSTPDSPLRLDATREYLRSTGVPGNFTFASTGFRNHNDAWVLRPSSARSKLRRWLHRQAPPP